MSTKSVDILATNETRLDCTISNGEINIPGYVIKRKDRNRSSGGVALYIRNITGLDASLSSFSTSRRCSRNRSPKDD